jgi:transcriptional antiterminator NusG
MSADSTEHEINLSEGDAVRVINGPFDELEGSVAEVDRERGKVKVLVNMFGRETPVELDFLQVERL